MADPLGSPMWAAHARTLFGDDPVRFDPRVKVVFPMIAENQRAFPVVIDARAIAGVVRMLLLVDLNPIPVAIDYRPVHAAPYVATRIKLDQRTPVRGAVQLASGAWLVSGGWVDAAGGGCSAPPVSRVKGDWAQHLGEMRGEAWPMAGGLARLRLHVRHPMDTGLVDNIATYHLEALRVKDAGGRMLGEMDIWAAVAEDPAITLMVEGGAGDAFTVEARDTNGRDYRALLPMARQSPMPGGR
ncbi:quinoprotein dehydrogenase-associated SoxYZ-like carrier [Sphingobium sp. HBC34]|uniref:Quinoprotein dehydrogenase-associated SoxYZ-like carrier n=2 Tax=Sphingobium cyanobacteriorum TaxID=3063954 RepID=A0ABT8ZM88_9SPHN|nr:quinoprotein dehydrogenase-associated SoxYZ-like carrier [Sphingobium sp. HBC34]MDO7835654.1 quinoprotein dehydrogenase-associated SoxYZ-like carrier [Sphingobium sp. HBC34]